MKIRLMIIMLIIFCNVFAVDKTFNSMNCIGHSEFIKKWRVFEIPSTWNRLQNPITHRDSYWMNDLLRLTMIISYILTRTINHKHYKVEVFTRIKMIIY